MPKADPSLSVAERVDAACDEFEREWRSGRRRPSVEEYVAAAPESDRDALRSALTAVETELLSGRGTANTATNQESVRSEIATATVARPADQSASLHRIGRFEVRAVLGSGAFGCVYRAFDPNLDREVAIKVPLPDSLRTPADRERFIKEAKAAAAIEHTNICRIHEVGEHEGQPYIVMAFVPGQSLAEILRSRQEPLPEKQVAFMIRKLALALDAAHKKGVVHRDLKPANIMYDKERKQLVVMDFGLARREASGDVRATQSGIVMGTPAYMSPEQARGDAKDVGPEGDIFSLGIIMYELLTGTRPFSGTAHEVIGQILLFDPETPSERRPGVDPQLEAICMKAMAKDPARRFASMKSFDAAINGYLQPGANPEAETVPPIETTPDTRTEADSDDGVLSTGSRKLADMFDAISEERKAAKAEAAAAIEEVTAKHRKFSFVIVAAVLFVGLIIAGGIGAILYFSNKEKPTQPQVQPQSQTVKINISVYIQGIDFNDTTLTFQLNGKDIPAEELSKDHELAVGEYELTVFRNNKKFKQVTFKVVGGPAPEVKDQKETTDESPQPPSIEPGFVSIFNGKDLDGWEAPFPAAFGVDPDGFLTAKGDVPPPNAANHWLYTKKQYTDYLLRLEFRFVKASPVESLAMISPRCDIDRSRQPVQPPHNLKVVLRNHGDRPQTGLVFAIPSQGVPPSKPVEALPTGEWHKLEMDMRGSRLVVTINGKLVNDVDFAKFDRTLIKKDDRWIVAELNRKSGHIGIHGTRNPVKFRNIRIKELTDELTPVPQGAIVSTFDKDDDGWTVAGDSHTQPIYQKAGGNPGGYVSATDNTNGNTWYWVAPKKFLGDRSASYGKILSFDLTQSAGAVNKQFKDSDVILEGEKLTLTFQLPQHPDKTWTNYKVPLTASKGWKVKTTGQAASEDELKAVLKSLKRLWIRGEYQTLPDYGQLDNVALEQ